MKKKTAVEPICYALTRKPIDPCFIIQIRNYLSKGKDFFSPRYLNGGSKPAHPAPLSRAECWVRSPGLLSALEHQHGEKERERLQSHQSWKWNLSDSALQHAQTGETYFGGKDGSMNPPLPLHFFFVFVFLL